MTKTTTTTGASAPSTMAQSSLYQTLRGHLAVLKLDACAEALSKNPRRSIRSICAATGP